MALEGCARIIKILMFIFNFVFFVAGIVVLAVGIYVNVNDAQYTEILPTFPFLNAGNILIACGVIVLVIGFLGCCGAVKENGCMLLIFFFMLLLILILEIAAGALAFAYKNQVEEFVIKDLTNGLSQYNTSAPLTKAWDELQQEFKCCGVNGSSDWANSNATFPPGKMYPDSCCMDPAAATCSVFTVGCRQGLVDALSANIYLVGAVGIAFGLIQILGLVFSMCLFCSLRDETKA